MARQSKREYFSERSIGSRGQRKKKMAMLEALAVKWIDCDQNRPSGRDFAGRCESIWSVFRCLARKGRRVILTILGEIKKRDPSCTSTVMKAGAC
jgi:hypothetical protein